MAYAAESEVPVDRTKGQIEQMLRVRGASEFATGWSETEDRIQFRMGNVTIRFTLPRVDPEDLTLTTRGNGQQRSPAEIERRIAQRDRSRWRALYLVNKAKLEAVEAGIAVFEKEFLAFVVMRDGSTIGDFIVPQIAAAKGPFQIEAKAGPSGSGRS